MIECSLSRGLTFNSIWIYRNNQFNILIYSILIRQIWCVKIQLRLDLAWVHVIHGAQMCIAKIGPWLSYISNLTYCIGGPSYKRSMSLWVSAARYGHVAPTMGQKHIKCFISYTVNQNILVLVNSIGCEWMFYMNICVFNFIWIRYHHNFKCLFELIEAFELYLKPKKNKIVNFILNLFKRSF